MMKPRAEIKIGWTTDGGGSGMKFLKIIFLSWNHGFTYICHSSAQLYSVILSIVA